MMWIFKNRKGEEYRMSDEEKKRLEDSYSISNTINIPKPNLNDYYLVRTEDEES